MIKQIKEIKFPNGTISQATVTQADMGEWTIASTIKVDGNVAPDFSDDWVVEYMGARYVMPLRSPAARKESTSFDSEIDLTFQHWAQRELQRWLFFTVQPTESGTAIPDKYEASVSLNLGDFVILFGQVLKFYYGDRIKIQLNPAWQYAPEPTTVSISKSYIWNVLLDLYKLYAVRWVILPDGDSEHYVIKVGYATEDINHIFEYGFQGGLLKVERQVQSADIHNMILGRGGEKNLPYRYFKDVDPNNPSFPADPDWITELAGIYFTRLMGATFRSYVQGWKAAHISQYPGYVAKGEANAYSPWAYRKGFTDEKFDLVEYVADEITVNPQAGDRYIALSPTFTACIVKDSSIDRYGPMMGVLDDNDDIYPTIQGVTVNPYGRIDQTVFVEQVTSDEYEEPENDAEQIALPRIYNEKWVNAESREWIELTSDYFTIPEGKYGDIDEGVKQLKLSTTQYSLGVMNINGRWYATIQQTEVSAGDKTVVLEEASLVALRGTETMVATGLQSGTYRFRLKTRIYNPNKEKIKVEFACDKPILTTATIQDETPNTFNIWVKNIWQTEKQTDETDRQYAERVWIPILGDRTGEEAKVVFSSGWLSIAEYEFTIVKTPVYDTSKTLDGVQSHWRITLAKSDADMESTGLPVPSTRQQGNAGDYFFFVGTNMHHFYVVWNEERLDDWKKDALIDTRDIKPTWIVTPDRVRFNNLQEGEVSTLLSQLTPGMGITLRDRRFIGGSQQELLYLQSLTITYREPTSEDAALNPDIEMQLGTDYSVAANPIQTIQGEVSALSKQIQGSLSNVEQAVRNVGDKKYLRKDMSDRTPYKLSADKGFEAGQYAEGISGARIDGRGNAEVESIRVRSYAEFKELIVNRQTTIEGDVLYTEGDTIEEVIAHDDGTYTLRLHAEYDGYTTAQIENNVIRGIYNDILNRLPQGTQGATSVKGATYYTCWMRVQTYNAAANTLDVVLYPDDQTPAGRNFPPQPMMKIARWGNSGDSDNPRYAQRQSCITVSATEGRIMKLTGVRKPIIDIGNVEFVTGPLPEAVTERLLLAPGTPGTYIHTLVAEQILQLDHLGRPKPTIVFYGAYDPDEEDYRSGDTLDPQRGDYPQHAVEYYGCQWLCNVTGTRNPPSWLTTDWTFYLGDPSFRVEITGGHPVRPARFTLNLAIKASKYNQDVTADVLAQDVAWTRYSEDNKGNPRTASDTIWAIKRGGSGKTLVLTEADLDIGPGGIGRYVVTATVTLRDGTEVSGSYSMK